jgi:hypothetical protein
MTQQLRNGDISPDHVDLRDTFAAAALTGFIRGMPSDSIFHLGLMAKQSYEVADAMLRERNGAVEARETVCQHVRGTVTQHCSLNFTLTDEEREAIREGADALYGNGCDEDAATLRSLLERLA